MIGDALGFARDDRDQDRVRAVEIAFCADGRAVRPARATVISVIDLPGEMLISEACGA